MSFPLSIHRYFTLFCIIAGVFAQTETESEQPPSALALPFDIPEWLIPDHGGVLPFLATDKLSVIGCTQEVEEASACNLPLLGEQGVFVCRRFGNVVSTSVCTPKVQGSVLGVQNDECGCCGAVCPEQCPCMCNEGRGVMIETKIVWFWTVNVCVTENVAAYLTPARKEILCDQSCVAK